ncbi:MAG: hypothetical protein IJZ74_01420 [Clostridia bacterium]|nr:hypothetical protein [Clostridia bacterium]
MFLRKLVVIVLPLVMTAALSMLLPLLEGIPFWTEVFKGLVLGIGLALLLPLSGATKKKEPFAHLLWIPLLCLSLTMISQYLWVIGISIPVLDMLHTTDGDVVLVECAFISFMAVHAIRTKK